MLLFKDINRDGSKIKLVAMAINKVTDIKIPKACVPPNSEAAKQPKPKLEVVVAVNP